MTVADMDYALIERLDRMSLQMTEISEELERQREMREMLLGLTESSGGTVDVLGFDPVRQPLQVKRRVGYLPEERGLYP